MSRRKVLLGVMGLALLTAAAGPLLAQRAPYGVEEYNAYVDVVRTEDPTARLQAIDTFLKQYPQSVLRAFIYPNMAEAAAQSQRWPKVTEATDGFLSMDRDQIVGVYKQSNLTEQHVDDAYYRALVLHTLAFLSSFRNGSPQADAVAAQAAERARLGLEMQAKLYANAQPPQGVTPEQFVQLKQQQATWFHGALAFVAFRNKDYKAAAPEYTQVVAADPQNPQMNYQLAVSYLKQEPPQWEPGVWSLARATVLNTKNPKPFREALTQNMAGYQAVANLACVEDQAEDLLALAQQSPTPPPGWRLPTAAEIGALRDQLNVAKLIENLKAGGDTAHLTWLAGCHLPFPELTGVVVGVDPAGTETAVVLKLAITDESAKAETPDIELQVNGQPELKTVKKGYEVRFTGTLTSYQPDPFLLRLSEGKINAEDLPKPEPAPRRRRGGAAGR